MLNKVHSYLDKKVKTMRKGGTISCRNIMTLLCLIPLVTIALVFKFSIPSREYYVMYVDTQDEPLFTINEKYLSLGLDSTVITDGFQNFNTSDPVLIQMIKYLSPAYLRIGGNQADQIIFSKDDLPNITNPNGNISSAYILTASNWLMLYNLARETNINVIYDLNSLLRFVNGTWNSKNAREMLDFSQENGVKVDWELGNEPNSYQHKFNTSVNATQLGIDFHTLRQILNHHELFKNSMLVGPSTTRLRTKEIEEYFLDFLESGSGAVSAITFHHYYFSGMNATWMDFLSPTTFNYLKICIDVVKGILKLVPEAYSKPIWLGETSTAWHGGAPNMSDRFIGSFLWIDKLGLSAKMGIDVIVRQSIFKGDYALLNDSYYPNPDWWVSVLYKKLVGSKVVTTQTKGDEKIRLYAHCAQENDLWNNRSAVVVFGLNINDKEGYVSFKELKSDSKFFAYELTSDSLFSQVIKLNGHYLNLEKYVKLPDMKPLVVMQKENCIIGAYSIVFWVFVDTNVNACQND